LEAEIEPFKGLLLGLFFIAVGASIDFDLVRERPGTIGLLVVGLMVGKFFVLALLGRAFRLSGDQNWLFSFALAQGGEFAFVLFSFAKKNGVVGTDIANPLIVSVALSMALTPLAMIAHERLILPRFGTKRSASRDQDDVHGDASVIIAGYGRFGQVVARLLKSAGIGSTLLDFDSDQVDLARKFGARVYYGDASRIDLLRAAGADKAKLIVLALDNTQKILELAHEVRKHFPHLTVLARARGRSEAFDLIEAGVEHVYRELLDSSLTVGRQALTLLGVPPHRAHRMSRSFRKYDEQFMRETALRRREQEDWIQFARAQNRDLEQVLAAEHQTEPNDEVTGNSNIEIGKVHQVRAADDDSSREES
jgi:voltage-gated potassium channel Kch